jgi:hypothetical protein
VSSQLGATTYPFLAVLCYNVRNEPTLVSTIDGNSSIQEILSQLTTILEQHGPSLQTLRQQRSVNDLNNVTAIHIFFNFNFNFLE